MNLANKGEWLQRIAFAAFFVAVGIVLSLGVLAAWLETYPDSSDPKNIYYVLWKHGLNINMDIDSALGAMSHDASALKRVKGLTIAQMKDRFGYVRTLDETTPYLRACHSTPRGHAETQGNREDVVFLRDSPWIVVLQNGKAVDLILCKGY